jgi:hypothetical protein
MAQGTPHFPINSVHLDVGRYVKDLQNEPSRKQQEILELQAQVKASQLNSAGLEFPEAGTNAKANENVPSSTETIGDQNIIVAQFILADLANSREGQGVLHSAQHPGLSNLMFGTWDNLAIGVKKDSSGRLTTLYKHPQSTGREHQQSHTLRV